MISVSQQQQRLQSPAAAIHSSNNNNQTTSRPSRGQRIQDSSFRTNDSDSNDTIQWESLPFIGACIGAGIRALLWLNGTVYLPETAAVSHRVRTACLCVSPILTTDAAIGGLYVYWAGKATEKDERGILYFNAVVMFLKAAVAFVIGSHARWTRTFESWNFLTFIASMSVLNLMVSLTTTSFSTYLNSATLVALTTSGQSPHLWPLLVIPIITVVLQIVNDAFIAPLRPDGYHGRYGNQMPVTWYESLLCNIEGFSGFLLTTVGIAMTATALNRQRQQLLAAAAIGKKLAQHARYLDTAAMRAVLEEYRAHPSCEPKIFAAHWVAVHHLEKYRPHLPLYLVSPPPGNDSALGAGIEPSRGASDHAGQKAHGGTRAPSSGGDFDDGHPSVFGRADSAFRGGSRGDAALVGGAFSRNGGNLANHDDTHRRQRRRRARRQGTTDNDDLSPLDSDAAARQRRDRNRDARSAGAAGEAVGNLGAIATATGSHRRHGNRNSGGNGGGGRGAANNPIPSNESTPVSTYEGVVEARREEDLQQIRRAVAAAFANTNTNLDRSGNHYYPLTPTGSMHARSPLGDHGFEAAFADEMAAMVRAAGSDAAAIAGGHVGGRYDLYEDSGAGAGAAAAAAAASRPTRYRHLGSDGESDHEMAPSSAAQGPLLKADGGGESDRRRDLGSAAAAAAAGVTAIPVPAEAEDDPRTTMARRRARRRGTSPTIPIHPPPDHAPGAAASPGASKQYPASRLARSGSAAAAPQLALVVAHHVRTVTFARISLFRPKAWTSPGSLILTSTGTIVYSSNPCPDFPASTGTTPGTPIGGAAMPSPPKRAIPLPPVPEPDPKVLAASLNAFVIETMAAADATGGFIYSVVADEVVVAWDAARRVSRSAVKACNFALRLSEATTPPALKLTTPATSRIGNPIPDGPSTTTDATISSARTRQQASPLLPNTFAAAMAIATVPRTHCLFVGDSHRRVFATLCLNDVWRGDYDRASAAAIAAAAADAQALYQKQLQEYEIKVRVFHVAHLQKQQLLQQQGAHPPGLPSQAVPSSPPPDQQKRGPSQPKTTAPLPVTKGENVQTRDVDLPLEQMPHAAILDDQPPPPQQQQRQRTSVSSQQTLPSFAPVLSFPPPVYQLAALEKMALTDIAIANASARAAALTKAANAAAAAAGAGTTTDGGTATATTTSARSGDGGGMVNPQRLSGDGSGIAPSGTFGASITHVPIRRRRVSSSAAPVGSVPDESVGGGGGGVTENIPPFAATTSAPLTVASTTTTATTTPATNTPTPQQAAPAPASQLLAPPPAVMGGGSQVAAAAPPHSPVVLSIASLFGTLPLPRLPDPFAPMMTCYVDANTTTVARRTHKFVEEQPPLPLPRGATAEEVEIIVAPMDANKPTFDGVSPSEGAAATVAAGGGAGIIASPAAAVTGASPRALIVVSAPAVVTSPAAGGGGGGTGQQQQDLRSPSSIAPLYRLVAAAPAEP